MRKNVRRAKARGTPFRSRRGWSGVQLAAVGAGPGRARVTKEQSKLLTDDFPTHIPQCGEIYFFYRFQEDALAFSNVNKELNRFF